MSTLRTRHTGVGAVGPERPTAPDAPCGPEIWGMSEMPDPRTVSTADARALSLVLFRRLRTLEEGTAQFSYVRNTLVELNLSLVKFAAGRFRGRSEPMEDILQVGTIGLIKAINRFDVEREVEFTSFAMPTIVGEIKRFFRDTSWAVRVPRRLQELRLDLAKTFDALEQESGRAPTTTELADRLEISEAEVVEGEVAANGYAAHSLEPLEDDESVSPLARRLGAEDPTLDVVECLECLKPMIAELSERERTILSLRFGDELTQSEIGERLGISQMHVSRLLARLLEKLRAGLLTDEAPPDDACPHTGAPVDGHQAEPRSLLSRAVTRLPLL
ncbi:SigB/SigF/SigG family RNA polymerase sigma factor [Streptomyces sp. NPDC127084]|uniref:SigB/SigF/SigG family RNA polymerase sigma factor n=1 Tax=Streptomyces sp. NPDC127084 TaxID=3347133 RepID=UPI003663E155